MIYAYVTINQRKREIFPDSTYDIDNLMQNLSNSIVVMSQTLATAWITHINNSCVRASINNE